jgi:hypothetical protein
MSNQVDHPDHYRSGDGSMEVIDIIESFQLGFHLGNVVKYVLRAGRKKSELEFPMLQDLRKAKWYLDRKISELEKVYGEGQ